MKEQVKKGVLEIFVLAILARGDSYGYKIVNDLIQYIEISESTLYPILRRLEKADELKTYNVIFQGRNRKYYQITVKGKEASR
jgi:PadR family transcriptional regulator, regulatory protein PadR